MKIQSATTIQAEPILADYAKPKPQAASLEKGAGTRETSAAAEKKAAQELKPSVDTGRQVDDEELKQEVKELNEQMDQMNRSIRFSIDESSKEVVVKVVDKTNGEVVTQIPPEAVLKLRERLEEMSGLLVEKTV